MTGENAACSNVTFVGDSFARALHGAFICLLKTKNFSMDVVDTKVPCEGTQCTWEHGVRMYRVSHTRLSGHFFVSFIWSPFLAKVALRNVCDLPCTSRQEKRLVILDTSIFLGGRQSALLRETHRNGGLCVIYAEKHWQSDMYSFWNESAWTWVAPSPLVEQKARATAVRELKRLRGLKTVELTTSADKHMMQSTYLLPKSVLEPPVEHLVKNHWCTEMISFSIMMHILSISNS